MEYLKAHEIDSMIYYPLPLHEQLCYKYLGYRPEDLPVAEKASKQVLSIPIFPDLSEEEKQFVAETISEFFK